jgi:hypothetical protein
MQLSFFGDKTHENVGTPSPIVADARQKPLLISVLVVCTTCKKQIPIGPHETIHSKEWLDENWKDLGNGQYMRVTDSCSRDCEMEKQGKAT